MADFNAHHANPGRSIMHVSVVNKPNKGRNGAVWQPGSPLANPRRLGDPRPGGGRWERGETIALYERDLRAVLDPAMQPK